MRIADVLRDNIARFSLNLLLLPDDFDSTATAGRTRLHYVHVSVVVRLAIHAELAVVIGEDVGSRTEIELGKDAFHPANILPHHVFAADLERLGKVVQLLVLRRLLQVLRLRLPSPLHVPLGAVRPDYSHSSCLQRVDHGVVDVGGLGDFEAEHHVMLLEILLSRHLHLLELAKEWLAGPVARLQKGGPLLLTS